MHEFLLFLAAAGFGALAWVMLVISDWLLRDKEPSRSQRSKSNSIQNRNVSADLASHY
jgi:hypothetical protein